MQDGNWIGGVGAVGAATGTSVGGPAGQQIATGAQTAQGMVQAGVDG